MEQYIKKSTLVAEIERLKNMQLSIFSKGETQENCYDSLTCISVYNEILSFINTLEVKEVEEEPASEDLELTWENMFDIFRLVNVVLDDYADGKTKKEVGEEVLRRFKAQKGEKV